MKAAILDTHNNKVGEINLPNQFQEEIRPDIIRRAVFSIQSHKRQSYASSHDAGKRASAKLSRRRRDYRGSYGYGISRVPRKIMSRRGMRMNWVGAFAPGTVGGRRAHPPKTSKIFGKKINKKERMKAIRSAITSTMSREMVVGRGHLAPDTYPFVLDEKLELLSKTKDVLEVFVRLGLGSELQKSEERRIRSGKGKLRGRKHKTKKSILIVVSKKNMLSKAASNIPGIDVVEVGSLNVELLAPGGIPGRLTLWTRAAINKLGQEKMFE